MYQIMISAGEASGDMHGASLLEALHARDIEFRCFGVGSDKLAAAGAELLIDFSDLAVMGYVEVLRNYRRLNQRLQLLQQKLQEQRPDILVLIDYAGFNLKLASTARELDIPVLYYISPKIWASRPGRIKKIAANVSHMALIFPFELELFKRAEVPATYVGNPLLDQMDLGVDKQTARQQLQEFSTNTTQSSADWIGLIPGSRQSEIRYNLPVMLAAAEQLYTKRNQSCRFFIPLADTITPELLQSVIEDAAISFEVEVVDQSHTVMKACDALMVGSGTATLEAAVIGTPMVTLYVMHWLNYLIMKRLVISEFVTLVNIQAGKEVVRELIQNQANSATLVAETQRLLDDSSYRSNMIDELSAIRQQMSEHSGNNVGNGASDRLATLVLDMLEGRA